MVDEGLDDLNLITSKRLVCLHGVVNEITVRSEVVGRECKITVTERICKECLQETPVRCR